MPYVVLARKYRPRGFAALLGQEPVVRALSNALSQGRLHHAYLFTGTRGVGKTTVSRILAKALNCVGPDGQGGVTATPCGACMPCTSIDGGRFVDYVELDAASNRGVDEMTQLLDQAVYKPVVGRYKVYMIDEVHMLSTTAFNAMLKTLEEPPDYLKFVLATTDPQKVPATVLSRCLQFNLRPLAPETVQAHLQQVLQTEQVAAEPGALRLVARAARGSMRDALSITDQAIAYGGGAIAEAGVRAMLGTVDRGQALGMARALAAGDGPALIGLADALHAAGLSAGAALDDLAQLLQELAVLQVAPDGADPADPEAAEASTLVTAFAADELQLYYSMALHSRAELSLAPDERSGLVMALLRMLAFRPPGAHRTTAPAIRPAAGVADEAMASPEPPASTRPARKPSAAPATAAAPLLRRTEARAVAAVPAAAYAPAEARAGVDTDAVADGDAGAGTNTGADAYISTDAEASAGAPAGAGADAGPNAGAGTGADTPAHAGAVGDADADRSAQADAGKPSTPPADAAPRSAMPAPSGAAEPALAAERASADTGETPADRWDALVRRLDAAGAVAALTRELAMQADCRAVAVDGDVEVWRLQVDSDMLRAPAQRDKLERAVAGSLGRPVRLEIAAGQPLDSPAMRHARRRRERQADAERQVREHPLVRTLLARYGTARIVPGSIKPI